MTKTLSGRLLFFTIITVMLVEVFIFVPSVANFRDDFYRSHLERAQIASLTLLADDMLEPMLEEELLTNAGVYNVVLHRDETRQLALSSSVPAPIETTFDLRYAGPLVLIRDALARMIDPTPDVVRVIGKPVSQGGLVIEVTMSTEGLRAALFDYARNILFLSLIISITTASMIFLVLRRILVKPIQMLADNMRAYADDPEDARRIIMPSTSAVELRQAEEALKSLQSDLTQSLKQRERLAQLGEAVAKISHDLRNILTSAQLFTDRFEMIDDPTVRRLAPKLENSIRRAVSLCENTLSFGRAQEPAPMLNRFAFANIVQDVFENERLEQSAHAMEYIDNLPSGLMVNADAEQMFRVISNLVRNARQAIVASGKAGQITISADATDDATLIKIRDNGPGLPPKAQEHLFQPFQGSVRKGGSGLGLAIAQELVRGHGGQLTLQETDDTGTTFQISLPRDDGTFSK